MDDFVNGFLKGACTVAVLVAVFLMGLVIVRITTGAW